jgi:ABC-2 type transport system ATP-binding protein
MNNNKITGRAENLVKEFGDFRAVNQVSFTLHRGEIFGFLGPNGSGKTTTIRMMLGLLTPTRGQVEILGTKMDGQSSSILPRIGYMSQRFSLYNDLTVLQNLNYYGQAYGLDSSVRKLRIKEAVIMSGLSGSEHIKTKDLAGGWRQRLALSAAILHQPEVLFLDEPTAGVDPVSRRSFWDLLYTLVARGISVFITTHYMDEAEHCHRLAFIQRGEIIAQGSLREIKQTMMPGQVLEIDTYQAGRVIRILREAYQNGDTGYKYLELHGSLVHLISPQAQSLSRKIKKLLTAEKITINSMSVVDPTLEDVFIACMRDKVPEVHHE